MAEEHDEAGGGFGWMDAAGIIAAAALAVILADIISDGRVITRRLNRWQAGGVTQDDPPGQ